MASTPAFTVGISPSISPFLSDGKRRSTRCTRAPETSLGRAPAPPTRRARSLQGVQLPHTPQSCKSREQQPPELSLSERVASLEAGGTWRVIQARAVVEEAAEGSDWALALRALHAFESAGFFAPRTLSTGVLSSLASAGRVEECAALLSRLFEETIPCHGDLRALPDDVVQRRQPNCRMVVVAANCAVRMLRVDAAVAMVRQMERRGVPANAYAYSVLIKGFGRAGRAHDVLATLREACGAVNPDLALYNAAVDAFVRCGQLRRARETMRAAEAAGLALDSRSYNPLFRGVARAGRLGDAFALVGEMQARGVPPSPVTLNALLHAAVAAREWRAVHRLLERALALAGGAWTQHKAVAYTTVIAGLAAARDIPAATALLADMAAALRASHPGARSGAGAGVATAVAPAPAAGASAGAPGAVTAPLSVPLAAILTALLEHGTVEEALGLFRGTQRRLALALAPDAYNAVIRGLARRGAPAAVAAAGDLLDEMLAVFWGGGRPSAAARGRAGLPYELVVAHNAVMDGLVRAGDAAGAERLLRAMRKRGVLPSAVSYTTVLNGFGRQKDLPAASRVLQDMRADGIAPDRVTMNAFLGACVRAGDVPAAIQVFEEMRAAGGALAPNLTSYSALIAAHGSVRDVDAAWKTYEDMKRARIFPNERLLDRMLAMCVARPGKRGDGYSRAPALLKSWTGGESWVGERGSILLRDMENSQCSAESKARWKRALKSVG